ncbi:Uncharacterised protein [Chromobacterium violaceum]|uniref:Uncharacterized protein n=1 Tax=Chromobacterium violaceum TaxID=536 RepID=A0A3S5DL59_CHRVL|nr:Uncharacterised protein [Chromobacterium violaceum]
MMRPRVAAPTGTEIGAPVLATAMPRFRPSELPSQWYGPRRRQLLLNFERQVGVYQLQGIINLRHGVARKFHVDHRANDLYDFALAHYRFLKINFYSSVDGYTAAAPATISDSSVVIAA